MIDKVTAMLMPTTYSLFKLVDCNIPCGMVFWAKTATVRWPSVATAGKTSACYVDQARTVRRCEDDQYLEFTVLVELVVDGQSFGMIPSL